MVRTPIDAAAADGQAAVDGARGTRKWFAADEEHTAVASSAGERAVGLARGGSRAALPFYVVSRWLVPEGAAVAKGQPVAELVRVAHRVVDSGADESPAPAPGVDAADGRRSAAAGSGAPLSGGASGWALGRVQVAAACSGRVRRLLVPAHERASQLTRRWLDRDDGDDVHAVAEAVTQLLAQLPLPSRIEPGAAIAEIEYCPHDLQYRGICTLCGQEIRADDDTPPSAAHALLENIDEAELAERHAVVAASAGGDSDGDGGAHGIDRLDVGGRSTVLPSRSHVPLAYQNQHLTVNYRTAERLEEENARRLVAQRKLSLVLDLDHTLLHATDDPRATVALRDLARMLQAEEPLGALEAFRDMLPEAVSRDVRSKPSTAAETDRASSPLSTTAVEAPAPAAEETAWQRLLQHLGIFSFQLLPSLPNTPPEAAAAAPVAAPPFDSTPITYYVKLRPGLQQFLQRLAPLFELHIYTMGSRPYADRVASMIDPDKRLFQARITSRDDFADGRLNQKNLKHVFPCDDSMVLVVDDREDVWVGGEAATAAGAPAFPNLIRARPYYFFRGLEEAYQRTTATATTTTTSPGEMSAADAVGAVGGAEMRDATTVPQRLRAWFAADRADREHLARLYELLRECHRRFFVECDRAMGMAGAADGDRAGQETVASHPRADDESSTTAAAADADETAVTAAAAMVPEPGGGSMRRETSPAVSSVAPVASSMSSVFGKEASTVPESPVASMPEGDALGEETEAAAAAASPSIVAALAQAGLRGPIWEAIRTAVADAAMLRSRPRDGAVAATPATLPAGEAAAAARGSVSPRCSQHPDATAVPFADGGGSLAGRFASGATAVATATTLGATAPQRHALDGNESMVCHCGSARDDALRQKIAGAMPRPPLHAAVLPSSGGHCPSSILGTDGAGDSELLLLRRRLYRSQSVATAEGCSERAIGYGDGGVEEEEEDAAAAAATAIGLRDSVELDSVGEPSPSPAPSFRPTEWDRHSEVHAEHGDELPLRPVCEEAEAASDGMVSDWSSLRHRAIQREMRADGGAVMEAGARGEPMNKRSRLQASTSRQPEEDASSSASSSSVPTVAAVRRGKGGRGGGRRRRQPRRRQPLRRHRRSAELDGSGSDSTTLATVGSAVVSSSPPRQPLRRSARVLAAKRAAVERRPVDDSGDARRDGRRTAAAAAKEIVAGATATCPRAPRHSSATLTAPEVDAASVSRAGGRSASPSGWPTSPRSVHEADEAPHRASNVEHPPQAEAQQRQHPYQRRPRRLARRSDAALPPETTADTASSAAAAATAPARRHPTAPASRTAATWTPPRRRWRPPANVKAIMATLRGSVLAGCHLCFSGVMARTGGGHPEEHELWRLAVRHGATCYRELVPEVTHLVVDAERGRDTAKTHAARRMGGVFVVRTEWLWYSLEEVRRESEIDWALDETEKERVSGDVHATTTMMMTDASPSATADSDKRRRFKAWLDVERVPSGESEAAYVLRRYREHMSVLRAQRLQSVHGEREDAGVVEMAGFARPPPPPLSDTAAADDDLLESELRAQLGDGAL